MASTEDGMDAWFEKARPYLTDDLQKLDLYEEGLHELQHERREWSRLWSTVSGQRDSYLIELHDTRQRLNELRGSWPMTISYVFLTLLVVAGSAWQLLEGDAIAAVTGGLIACMSVVLGLANLPRGRRRGR